MGPTSLATRSLAVTFLFSLFSNLTINESLNGDESWSRFQNGGATISTSDLPTKWSPSDLSWQSQLAGYGQSSPVLDDKIIYVTSTLGDMKEKLFVEGFDRATGQRLWVHEAKNSSPTKNTTYVSRAAPSPICDAAGVIAMFEGGNIIAIDRDGQVGWSRDLVAEFGAISSRHGLGSSLEQDDEHVFV